MRDSTLSTIDAILGSGRVEKAAFSEPQQELIRAFFSHPASAWAKQKFPQPKSATQNKRQRQASTDKCAGIVCEEAVPTSTSRCATNASSPPSSTTLPFPGSSHSNNSARPTFPVVTTVSATSAPLQQCDLELELREPEPLVSRIKEDKLVASYEPIGDVDNFFKNLLEFQGQWNCFPPPQYICHQVTLFCLYIAATAQEKMSKAAGKFAATLLVSLYPHQQLPASANQLWQTHSGKFGKDIQALYRDCRKLGRACQYVREILGPGAMLLLDDFSAW